MDADMEHDELDWGDVDAPMPDDDAISLGGADEDDDLAALQKYQAPRAAAQGDDAPADPSPPAPAAPADEAAPSNAPPDSQSAGPLPQPAPRPDPPRPRRERDRERDYREREYRERDRDERRQRTEGSSSSASSNARPPPPPPPQSRSRGAHNQMPAGNMALPAKPQLIHSTSYGGYQQPIEAPAQRPARDRDRARSDDPPPPPPAAQRISRDELDGLPSEWQICTSSKGADFFYNRLTQETQWQRPKLSKPSPPPPRGPQQSARPPPRTDSYGPGPGRHDSSADYRGGSDPDPRHYPSAPAPPEPSSSAWPAARRDYPPAAPPAADERMLRRGGQHYSPEQTRGRREPAPPVPRPQSPPLPRRHSLSPPARYEVKRGSNSWRPEDDAPRGVAAAGKWQHDQFAERDRERERERGRAPERGRVQQDQNGPSNRNRRPPRARSVENNSSSSNNNNANANAIAPRAPAADAPRRRSPPPPPPPPTLLPSPPQSVPTLASTSATTSPLRPPTPPREREELPVKEGVKRPREEDEAPKAQPLAAPPQEEVDAKRRRTDSDPDSTRARRTPPAKDIGVAHDDDSPRKRKPLPPQGELFQAKRVPPPPPSPAKPREDLQPPPHPHPHPHPPAPRREPSFRAPAAADYKQERDRDRLPSGPRADREFRTRRDSMGRGEHPPAPPQPQRSPTFNVNGRSPLPPPGPPLHVDTSGPRQSRFGPPQQRNSPAGEWNQHPLPPREVAGRPPRMDLQASPMENGRALHPERERERRGPPPRQARYGASPHTGAPPPLPSPGPGPGPIPVASQQGFYQNTGPSRSPHISPALDRNQMPLPPSYVQQRPNRGAEFPMRDQGPPPPPRGNQNNWNDRPRPTRNERSASFRAEGGHYRRSRSASPHRQYAPPPPGDNMMPSQDWGRGPPPPPPHRSPEQRLVNGMHPERAGLVSGAGAPPPGVAGPSRQPSFYPPAHDRERERDRDRERGPPPGKMRHDALGLDPRGMQVPPPPLERKASLIDRISDPNESAWAGDADARMDDAAAAADGGEGPGGGGFRRMRSNANGRYPPRRGTGRRQHGHVHGR